MKPLSVAFHCELVVVMKRNMSFLALQTVRCSISNGRIYWQIWRIAPVQRFVISKFMT
ncbi:hypothetical protein CKA32_003038 [Geitlerinema sp. FC II]|nr:hypothetical protein CKA32_003038 [Geitlerinema sp. FC II]